MKSIFLCNDPGRLRQVYADDLRERLKTEAGLISDRCFTAIDIQNSPEDFRDVTAVFSTWGMPSFTVDQLGEAFPALRAVFYAAGSVQHFARPFLARGVKVFSAWAANAVPVAEFTVAQIVLANKGYFGALKPMREGDRAAANRVMMQSPGNYGAAVGIIGAGMIGSLVLSMLKAYHLTTLVFDPFLSDEKAAGLGARKVDLPELFASCHVISNHLANNAQTVGMLNTGCFSRMGENAIFINTGRGAQVVEDDLIAALREKPGRMALLDVTYPEPPTKESPLLTLPNALLSPHMAGSQSDEFHRMSEYMAEEYRLLAAGLPTRYEVTPAMLATMA